MGKAFEEALLHALHRVFGWIFTSAPAWLRPVLSISCKLLFLLVAVYIALEAYNKCRKVVIDLWPRFSEAERKRNGRRRRFCAFLRSQIDNSDQAIRWSEAAVWKDDHYADLEAEVEAEGARRAETVFAWIFDRGTGIRREKSLTAAIMRTRERLVVLEGAAGAGKTVALRHVAHTLAKEAELSHSNQRLLAVYIDLKTLERSPDQRIDSTLIQSHVLKSINTLGSVDVEQFVKEELARGSENGSLTILFDSFDEIPDVLSATDANTVVRAYGLAIDAFVGRLGRTRAVVASRPFRGPRRLGWPVFRILPLTQERQQSLIRLLRLPDPMGPHLRGELENARLEIQAVAENPFFLRLLCEHTRAGKPFPDNVFELFETFVDTRFAVDSARLQASFGLDAVSVRAFAEVTAFEMTYRSEFGLSPRDAQLAEHLTAQVAMSRAAVEAHLDALCSTGLATRQVADGRFTFVHRRLQEYFATCSLSIRPDLIAPSTLLADGRWREATVALLQTQGSNRLRTIIEAATISLEAMCIQVSADIVTLPPDATPNHSPRWFPWPKNALHLMGLLQDGLSGEPALVPARIRECIGLLASAAVENGTVLDRKWALETAGLSDPLVFEKLLSHTLPSEIEILTDAAYRHAARLRFIPADLAALIRIMILRRAFARPSKRNWTGVFVYLERLHGGEVFVRLAQMLRLASYCDFVLSFATILILAFSSALFRSLSFTAVATCISMWVVSFRFPQGKMGSRCAVAYQKRAFWRFGTLAWFASLLWMRFLWNTHYRLLIIAGVSCFPVLPILFSVSAVGWTRFADVPSPLAWPLLPLMSARRWIVREPSRWALRRLAAARAIVPRIPQLVTRLPQLLWRLLCGTAAFFGGMLALSAAGAVVAIGLGSALSAVGVKTDRELVTGICFWIGVGVTFFGSSALQWVNILARNVGDLWLLSRVTGLGKLTRGEFLRTLSGFQSDRSASRFVRSCRLHRRLQETDDSFRAVGELVLAMDGGNYDHLLLPDFETFLAHGKGPRVMSEVARLYEELSWNSGGVEDMGSVVSQGGAAGD
jgi:hypothetical protein